MLVSRAVSTTACSAQALAMPYTGVQMIVVVVLALARVFWVRVLGLLVKLVSLVSLVWEMGVGVGVGVALRLGSGGLGVVCLPDWLRSSWVF